MTTTEAPPKTPQGPTPAKRTFAFARNTWRGLTSMRTALVLLFLLALAALPGALLPQRKLNAPKVAEYITAHGWWGTLLDKLEFYDVYSSIWFSAIYLLLMISLIGCLTPRSFEYVRAMRAKPVLTPRNLARMPHYRLGRGKTDVAAEIAAVHKQLSGWRRIEREEADGVRTISAERGFLRETGNLVFHFSMLGLIVFFAIGKLYGYEGQVIVQADGDSFCNAGIYNYDSFNAGLRVDGTDLDPFCVKVHDFTARYTASGQPDYYHSNIEYQSGPDLETGIWRPYGLEVNSPLRTAGDRVYLLGHGYSPKFTVTFPDGSQRTQNTQWRTVDPSTMLAEGATKFDQPGITDEVQRRTRQLAITGLFAPTAFLHGSVLTSSAPEADDPAVAVDVLRGDLGLDAGRGQSVFEVDQTLVDDGRLKKVARQNLKVGQELKLDDGTKVRFDGVGQWVSLQVSHDPTQGFVLGFAIAMFLGLGGSLLVKRRRLWVRVKPGTEDDPGTVIEVAGLARTDQAGYGEEFHRVSERLISGQKG
ncbi:cytochrome C biogenesis protein [Amycolatopsis mediterranei S699]|uniref:Cytochrome c biogenesis protein n=2 Tax=Amycolatopsis mediterranei TaxID=33910 RepID=A0A0H3CWM1_AMYMU|nr:cytochrome c biogenesis protein ResB [Amycolatopsis mediterranei]ADJ42319.1 cytochrome c biogenesis protein [Amycolatopsis mediterranei U32]AEK39003.1 cytochrome C biogenesis protein [Amycolatopsis mediterranei S699]AFO74033.1 cytochrome C biogenesis protein [Amycolatopsis mediterranei S699]AGT81162.1 cytochrome C biogenesis protein [Amycolatopsis mediterranei RB]KDO09773.1 cytochrome C biogenesis protein ResB [Amycolatopsis mediterranei]